jgi:hypothetical protein
MIKFVCFSMVTNVIRVKFNHSNVQRFFLCSLQITLQEFKRLITYYPLVSQTHGQKKSPDLSGDFFL